MMFLTLYMRLPKFLFIITLLTSSGFSSLASEIIAGYPEFKPFTFTERDNAKGEGIAILQNIGQEMNWAIQPVAVQTYGNGIRRLQQNKIDLLLLASQNSERDKIAKFSRPVMFNRWSWVTLKTKPVDFQDPNLKRHLRVVTYNHSNTHSWLQQNRYELIYATTDVVAMLRQLKNHRVDAIFISEHVLVEALNLSELNKEDLTFNVETIKEMGIYVNLQFLERNPNFMTQLNSAIENLTGDKL